MFDPTTRDEPATGAPGPAASPGGHAEPVTPPDVPAPDASADERTATLEALAALRAEIDRRLIATLADAHHTGDTTVTSGVDTETWLRLNTGMTGREARRAVTLVERLAVLPDLAAMLSDGWVTVPVAGQLAAWAMDLPAGERGAFLAEVLDPATVALEQISEDLLRRGEWAWIHALSQQQVEQTARRAYAARWLAIQPTLDGGMALNGWFDAESSAPIAAAFDDATVLSTADDPDPATPAQARADGLRTICEGWLGGGSGRPAKPRLVATVTLADLVEARAVARVDRATAAPPDGGTPWLSPRAVDRLACDTLVTRIVTDPRGAPVSVDALGDDLPVAYRTAVLTRDGGCRFPGCRAPAAWSDVHHVIWRSRGGRTHPDNLVSLCRRHHTTIHHDRRWRLQLDADGVLSVRRGRRTWTTRPAIRPDPTTGRAPPRPLGHRDDGTPSDRSPP